MARKNIKRSKLQLIHQMHDYIMNTGDEEIHMVWLEEGLPDCPDEEDFEFFVEDEEFEGLCRLFAELTKNL